MRSAEQNSHTDSGTTALIVAVVAMIMALSAALTRAAEPERANPLRTQLAKQEKSIPQINPLSRRVDFFQILKQPRRSDRPGRVVQPGRVIQPVQFQIEAEADTETQVPNELPLLPPAEDPAPVQVDSPEADQNTDQEDILALESQGDFPRVPISQLTTSIALPPGDVPTNFAAKAFEQYSENHYYEQPARGWAMTSFEWDAPALCHQPLYFEEVNLERYGYSVGLLQPGVSAAHFFGTVVALPYKTCAEPYHQCIYTLGHYRPGSCVPYRYHYPPFRVDAGLWQAGVVTGLIFLIP